MSKKRKSPKEELDLAIELRKEANKKIEEAKKKVREEEEKAAVKLARKLMKAYGTSDFDAIVGTIKEDVISQSLPAQPNILEEDLQYLKSLADELRNEKFVDYKKVFEEIKRRF